MRRIDTAIVHHTAGPATATVADIRRIHQTKGWSDIGYHWLVHQLPAGPWTVSAGRPEVLVGAHDAGENATSIGIAIAGDYSGGRLVPVDGWHVLLATFVSRCRAHQIRASRVFGHNENEPAATATLCPGFDVGALREQLAELLTHAA